MITSAEKQNLLKDVRALGQKAKARANPFIKRGLYMPELNNLKVNMSIIKSKGRNYNADLYFGVSINNTVDELLKMKKEFEKYLKASENRKFTDMRRKAKKKQEKEQKDFEEIVKESVAKNIEIPKTAKPRTVNEIMRDESFLEESAHYGATLGDDLGSVTIGEIYKIVREDKKLSKEEAAEIIRDAKDLKDIGEYLTDIKEFIGNKISDCTENDMIERFKDEAIRNAGSRESYNTDEDYFRSVNNNYRIAVNRHFTSL